MKKNKIKGFTTPEYPLIVFVMAIMCVGVYFVYNKIQLLQLEQMEFSWFASIIEQKNNTLQSDLNHQIKQTETHIYQVVSSPTVQSEISPNTSIKVVKNDFTLITYQGLDNEKCFYALKAWQKQPEKEKNLMYITLNGDALPQALSEQDMKNRCLKQDNLFLISNLDNDKIKPINK